MADVDRMPKVDINSSSAPLNKNLLDYMKLVEKQNLERVQKLRKIRRNNLITAFSLGAGVLGIYAYSILSVKQESFLDDFNPPSTNPPQ
ncbi:coiled-coil domain containing 56 [Rhodnius prolixus]|uniref:coiled-coil domain containing 56 n=1 Tax=Rhodnius prolixus TaxID=13249 RepID=UPI000356B9B5